MNEIFSSILILTQTANICQPSSHATYSLKTDRGLIMVSKSFIVLRPNFMLRYYLNSHPSPQFGCSTAERNNIKFTDRR